MNNQEIIKAYTEQVEKVLNEARDLAYNVQRVEKTDPTK